MRFYLPPDLLCAMPIDGLAPEAVRELIDRVSERIEELGRSEQLIHPTLAAHLAMTIRTDLDNAGG